MDLRTRVVELASGLVGLNQEDVPFFISAIGQIYRIETPKVKGYFTSKR